MPLRADLGHALVGEIVETGSDQAEGKAEDDHHEPAGKRGCDAGLGDLVGEAEALGQGAKKRRSAQLPLRREWT